MVDELSVRNRATREALAIASSDPSAAVSILSAALEGASVAETARIARHAGAICQAMGDLKRAAEFYRQAAEADPDDGYIYLALGQIYREVGQVEDARAMLALCLAALADGGDQDLLDVATRTMSELRGGEKESGG